MNWSSSVGPDLVSYRLIELLLDTSPHILLNGLNLVASGEFLPPQWSHGRISVLPKIKAGQSVDLRNPANYRPITVSSCLLRVFEGVLVSKLESLMTRRLSDVQGGFVSGRGTSEQIFAVREICWRSRRERKPLALAFLDFRKAFDSVWHDGLLFKLWARFGVRGKVWRIVKLLLDHNFVRVEIGAVKTKFVKLNAGTRQGGKSSPLLFNIFVDDIVERLDETELGIQVGIFLIVCLLYADDIVLFARSPEELVRLFSVVERWASRWRLEFNVSKCKILVVFASKTMMRKFRETRFLLCGERVKKVLTVDYLGMETNARLSLAKTPGRIRPKVEKTVNFLRWVSAAKNGLRSHVVLPLFWALVRPLMTVNGQLANYPMAIKRTFKLPLFTKTASLQILVGIPPLAATLDYLRPDFGLS